MLKLRCERKPQASTITKPQRGRDVNAPRKIKAGSSRMVRVNQRSHAVHRVVKSRDVECFESKTWRATTELWFENSKLVVMQCGLTGEFAKGDNISNHTILELATRQALEQTTCPGVVRCNNGKSYAVSCQLRTLRPFELDLVSPAVHQAQVLSALKVPRQPRRKSAARPHEVGQKKCPVCGWLHDDGFTQIRPDADGVITLSGILPDIMRVVHRAHEKGFERLITKDDELRRVCGGYRHPCKAFGDLNRSADYQRLFDTRRRGFISLRGAVGRNRNKSESSPE